MLFFVCYDITDSKRLYKISKYLERKGIRIQYSFFSCELNKKEYTILKTELLKLINAKNDKICFVPICENCLNKILYIGCDKSFILPDFMVL
ncbi:MAG: CRISPR-associated endonuclease Cas2 [Pleomorphochaeta sp.]